MDNLINYEERRKKLYSFKYLIFLAIPLFVELLLQMVVGYSDQIMMSKYETAVTAITNSNSILNIIINAFTVFSSASIILITQFKGSQNKENEKKVYSVCFFFNLIVSTIISLMILFFGRYFLKAIRCPSDSYNEAVKYLTITGGVIVFQLMSITFAALLKSNSLMKESMIINLVVNIINIVGNFILIPHLEIVGVALASSISRFIGLILMIIVYIWKVRIKFSFKEFRSSMNILKKYIGVGVPASSESFSYQSSQLIIQICINSFGIAVVNIKTYASMFAMITYMVTEAVSLGMQIVIGELLGNGDTKEAEHKVKQTLVFGIIASEIFAVLFFITAKWDFRIFNVTDKEMLSLGQKIMFIEIFLELGRAVNIVCVRTLQTAGDILFPTILSIIFCWVVAVFGSFLLGHDKFIGLGLPGVWISMAADECSRAVIFLIRLKKGKWKNKKIALV